MKNAIRIFAVLTLVITSSKNVFAEATSTDSNWYARLGIGYADQIDNYNEVNEAETEWEFDGGPNLTISAGHSSYSWAVEGEVSYKKMDATTDIFTGTSTTLNLKGDQSQLAVMLNGFWYPKPNWKVSPYLGVGLGITRISWNDIRARGTSFRIDDSDNVFTYQLILGGSYKITSQIHLEADYRYFAPDDVEVTTNMGEVGKFENQELSIFSLALKYKF